MAYQNRIDITVETFKGLTKRANNIETRGLTILGDYTKLFRELDNLNNNNISLIQKIPPNLDNITGFPGTQNESLKQISDLIAILFTKLANLDNNANQAVDTFKQENSISSDTIDECLSDLCTNSRQIDSIKFSINENKQNLPSKLSKYQKSINNIVTLKTKVKKQSEFVKLMSKILKIRNDNSIFQRSNFVPAAEKCMDKILLNSTNSVELIKKQFLIRKDILKKIINTNQEIIENINETSSKMIEIINKINFQSDFQNFIQSNKIIRYDILPDEFKPLDLSHECFAQIPKVSYVLSFQMYPYSMARIKYEFRAEDQKEISVKKGKIVLLMEDLNLNWTFIQNPYTNQMGYVPSSFLEEIGKGIGVLLNEFDAQDEILSKGDYVAIEDSVDPEYYRIHTISDSVFNVPVSFIGIISEF